MDTSLKMVPINKPAVMRPLNASQGRQMQPLERDDKQGEFNTIHRSGRKFTFEEQKQRLRDAAQDFEAIFARQIMKHLRSGIIGDGMFGSGAAGEIYSDMMDNAIADKISERGDLGLADVLYRQLIKRIEPLGVPEADK